MFVIAVMSRKGGVGRSTLAANLALLLSEQGRSVALIEHDPQGTLSAHVGVPPASAGWAGAWIAGQPLAPVVHQVNSYLRVLPLGPVPDAGEAALAQAVAERPALPELLRAVAGEVVLIDTPAGDSVFASQARACADAVLSVWLCDMASLHAHEAGRDPLPASGLHRHVLNQINATRVVRRELFKAWRARLGETLLPVPVHQDESVSDALHAGGAVVRLFRHSQSAHDLQGIADWLVTHWLGMKGAI